MIIRREGFTPPEQSIVRKNERSARYLEHLNEAAKPIIGYISSSENVKWQELAKKASEVDYDPKTDYCISTIDTRPKFTRGLANCTSLVFAGTDSQTEQNISFLTHQNDLRSHSDNAFLKELKTKLEEMQKRCMHGTMDAALAGGSFAHPVREQQYIETIRTIAELIQKKIGFYPYIAAGPKLRTADDAVYYDTQGTKMYVYRENYDNSDTSNSGYTVDELDKLADVWRQDREQKNIA